MKIIKSFKIPKGKREYYFVLALGVILVLIVIGIAFLSFSQSGQPVPTKITQTIFSPTPSLIPPPPTLNPQQKLHLNIDAASQLVTKEEQRIPLSQSDEQAKARILEFLPSGQNYGDVYTSSNIDIYYIQSLDLFVVEIETIDIASAKNEAENWFKQQGMSQEGICNLPLGFYLGSYPSEVLQNSNFIFNPLPDGC